MTYATLRDRALSQVGCLGQSEAQIVAQTALEEAMKFVAFKVRIPSLIASATFTALASPDLEVNAIPLGSAGFNISSSYQAPDRLYIAVDSNATVPGLPYEFLEYAYFLDLQAIPSTIRIGISSPYTADDRPLYCYTITPANTVWIRSIVQGNIVTFYYRISPVAYNSSSSPEILPMFDYILVNGAVIALKEWLREPAEVTTLWSLFEAGLTPDTQKYDEFLNGQRKRSHLKVHRSYRPR